MHLLAYQLSYLFLVKTEKMAKLQRETDVANVLSQMSQLVQYPHENGNLTESFTSKDAATSNENEDTEHSYAQNNTSKRKIPTLNADKTSIKAKKKHICELCGRAFSKRCNLQSHMRVHSGEKPHACDVCDHAFSNVWDLIKHSRIHSGEKPYKCCHCDRRFAAFGSHQRHLRLHTNEKPYKCHVCLKDFSRLDSYKNHLNTHSDKKPFICKTCDRKFAYPSTYKRHINTHLGEKKFSCDVCDKSFARQDCLLTHKRKHEKCKNEKSQTKNPSASLESVIDINEGELLLCPSTEIESSSSYSVNADLSPIPILLSMAECAVVNGSMCNNTEYLDSASLLAAASEIELGTSTEIPTSHYDVGMDLEGCSILPKSQDQSSVASSSNGFTRLENVVLDRESVPTTSAGFVTDKSKEGSLEGESSDGDAYTTKSPFFRHDISLLYQIGMQEAFRNDSAGTNTVSNHTLDRDHNIRDRNHDDDDDDDDAVDDDDDDSNDRQDTIIDSCDMQPPVESTFNDSFESQSFAADVAMPEATVSYSFAF